MRITVLGGGGAFPTPDRGCSGYLVEEQGYRLLVDPGYATLPRLLEILPAHEVDAVFVTHSHPDHCADLNPLLRARHLSDEPAPALPVHALEGALDAVLALDATMLAAAYRLHEFAAGDHLELGPLSATTRALDHFVPNVGVRLEAGGVALAYTGDGGDDPGVVTLAAGADLLVAEATFSEQVPSDSAGKLSSASRAGEHAIAAKVARLLLAHLWPGDDDEVAVRAARRTYDGPIDVARPGLRIDLSPSTP